MLRLPVCQVSCEPTIAQINYSQAALCCNWKAEKTSARDAPSASYCCIRSNHLARYTDWEGVPGVEGPARRWVPDTGRTWSWAEWSHSHYIIGEESFSNSHKHKRGSMSLNVVFSSASLCSATKAVTHKLGRRRVDRITARKKKRLLQPFFCPLPSYSESDCKK